MAYDEGLAHRVREGLIDEPRVEEKKMFGGLCFMVQGHMCCGILESELMARVGPEQYQDCLARPHAREMNFTGRSMKGMIFVDETGLAQDEDLAEWLACCLRFVHSLEPK